MIGEEIQTTKERKRILIFGCRQTRGVSFRCLLHHMSNMAAYDSLHVTINSDIEGRRDIVRSSSCG